MTYNYIALLVRIVRAPDRNPRCATRGSL